MASIEKQAKQNSWFASDQPYYVTTKHKRNEYAFYPTYEEWKRLSYGIQADKILELFILPMRNGNPNGSEILFRGMDDSAFYPTYEEWKLTLAEIKPITNLPFYPTYEEWKLYPLSSNHFLTFPFYPTYEEWKQSLFFNNAIRYSLLFILPMRNGNKHIVIIYMRPIIDFLSYL